MTTLWLVRHGETQSNIDRVFQGQLDTPLTERGFRQATAVGAALQDVTFDAVYSSDLSRASDTARAIVNGRSEIQFDKRLREMHYGVLQGVAIARFRDVLAQHGVADAWGPGTFSRDGMAPPEGESIADLCARLRDFLGDLDRDIERGPLGNVLLVAHGGTLRALMTLLLDLPIERRTIFAFANCGLSRVVRLHDESHLDLHNSILWSD